MVNVFPPIVRVPDRPLLLALDATVYDTVPLPVPLAPTVIVIQPALLVAVHAQSLAVDVTLTLPLLALDATDALDELNVIVHVTPDCVRLKVLPATVSVPDRALLLEFGATL